MTRATLDDGIVVLDSIFPTRVPFGFRNTEINALFDRLPGLCSYALHPMRPGPLAWFQHGYGVEEATFLANKAGYLASHPRHADRVKYLHPGRRYRFQLAYLFFLAETYTALPFLERNGIPFVFVLYPGGAFGLDNPSSDAMLAELFSSPCFRKVITTQKATRDYLLRKDLCPPERIEHLFGGFLQFDPDQVPPKILYPEAKGTLDICFVGAKYTPRGVDKGYDLFVEAAKLLAPRHPELRFHVVGGFAADDIDVSSLGDRVRFYGFRQPDWLRDFYPAMDICLSPNRPFRKYTGDFDGYPMGFEQSIFEVAMFTSDPLGNNDGLYTAEEIVTIPCDAKGIVDCLEPYLADLDALRRLAGRGKEKTRVLFDNRARLERIAGLLEREADAATVAEADREAFLCTVRGSDPEWIEVMVPYLETFTPGDPVALLLALEPEATGAPDADEVKEALRQVLAGLGMDCFPDIILVERPEDLPGIARGLGSIQGPPRDAAGVDGEGMMARRFRHALAMRERA